MSDRGMKKWNAYKSLPEHDVTLLRNSREKEKVERPLLSSDKEEEINEILSNYHGQKLRLTYYASGYIKEVEIYIKKIDVYNRKIITTDNDKFNFIDILDLENIED